MLINVPLNCRKCSQILTMKNLSEKTIKIETFVFVKKRI